MPPPPPPEPTDAHHARWLAAVAPPDWVNPSPAPRYDLVVLGGGTAGLVSAMGAAGLGAKVALVERHRLGGDCLNYGCVPSKTLLRAGRAAAEARAGAAFGVHSVPRVDFAAVMERVRRVRAEIAPHDSATRLRAAGVDVFLGEARFVARQAVEVAGARLTFRKAVIATGARPVVPDVPGLAEAGCLTNETVFNLTALAARLVVIGGGPVGCELAQAFARLGSTVTLVQRHAHLLEREEPAAAEIVQRRLVAEGVRLLLDARPVRAAQVPGGRLFVCATPGGEILLEADEILAGTGRQPNVEGLGLDVAGVAFDLRRGVQVDDRLRTTNPRIFAAGDVCLAAKFTHSADAAARTVIQNALFAGRKKFPAIVIPRVTYTDPEIASVGVSADGPDVVTLTRELKDVDRARADGAEGGFVRLRVATRNGRLLGATLVAPHAGEMLPLLTLAVQQGLRLGDLGGIVFAYPTMAEAVRQCADEWSRRRLTPTTKKILACWLSLGR